MSYFLQICNGCLELKKCMHGLCDDCEAKEREILEGDKDNEKEELDETQDKVIQCNT